MKIYINYHTFLSRAQHSPRGGVCRLGLTQQKYIEKMKCMFSSGILKASDNFNMLVYTCKSRRTLLINFCLLCFGILRMFYIFSVFTECIILYIPFRLLAYLCIYQVYSVYLLRIWACCSLRRVKFRDNLAQLGSIKINTHKSIIRQKLCIQNKFLAIMHALSFFIT